MSIPRQSISDNSTYFKIVPSQQPRQRNVSRDLSEMVVEDHLRMERINSVHSEIRQVFSSSQMRDAVAREHSLHTHKNAIQQVHDEMRRTSIDQNLKSLLNKEVECERHRRISVMESSLENPKSLVSRCMEHTNNVLSQVHDNLKDLFTRRESEHQSQIQQERSVFEESKENMLQEFRKRSASQQISKNIDQNKLEYIKSFAERLDNQDFRQTDSRLLDVQEELIRMHHKNEGARLHQERSEIETAKQRKSLVEEDLLRRHNRIQARRLSDFQWKSSLATIDSLKQFNKSDDARMRRLSTVHSELMSKSTRKE